jgi:hypothetical protein
VAQIATDAAVEVCGVCGQPRLYYVGSCGLCIECYIAEQIPPKFQVLEEYQNGNATRTPPLGLEWLDRQPPKICTIALCGKKPRGG